jgi:phenylalanine-4-hydroxylase
VADATSPEQPSPIPAHLAQFVVEQDYAQYTEIDQAVWRFVLLQTYSRLAQTAHPAYRDGLAATGLSVERIPRIAEMAACLARFGWGAVCVDGFIPPRAFQEFQAAGILPIAADMRTRAHLVYTPAPDIIHEAAGHAPILPDPIYAAYLRKVGELGRRAFATPEDAAVYRAIFELSELKETPGANAAQIAAAEARVQAATGAIREASEAARVARLYWWTAEYGLVGTPAEYKLYGAGLLSSLWESYSCHDPAVRKLPLSAACCDVAYDITKPQPQLFVVPNFERLFDVLSEVERSLASERGRAHALAAALASGELTSFVLEGGAFVCGVPEQLIGDVEAGVLSLRGPIGLGRDQTLLGRLAPEREPYRVPLGRLKDGRALSDLACAPIATGAGVRWEFRSGLVVTGSWGSPRVAASGQAGALRLTDYTMTLEGSLGFVSRGALLELPTGSELVTATPGALDANFFEPSEPNRRTVPRPRSLDASECALLSLYERALAVHRSLLGARAVAAFEQIHRELQQDHPEEWLLRWNLLESLLKLGEGPELSQTLTAELDLLEERFSHREPIASGLRYLARRAA